MYYFIMFLIKATSQEGIIVKNPGSFYEPGARNHTWVKIKPEYMNSSTDNFDLLVVGMTRACRIHRNYSSSLND